MLDQDYPLMSQCVADRVPVWLPSKGQGVTRFSHLHLATCYIISLQVAHGALGWRRSATYAERALNPTPVMSSSVLEGSASVVPAGVRERGKGLTQLKSRAV